MGGETDQVKWRGVRPIYGISGIWPGRDAVRVHAREINDAAGDVILYTVPAGKKLYLPNLILSSYQPDDKEARARVWVRNDSDVLQYYVAEIRFGTAGQFVVPCHFVPALELLAGWDLVLTNELI